MSEEQIAAEEAVTVDQRTEAEIAADEAGTAVVTDGYTGLDAEGAVADEAPAIAEGSVADGAEVPYEAETLAQAEESNPVIEDVVNADPIDDGRVQEDDAPVHHVNQALERHEDGTWKGQFGETLANPEKPFSADNPVASAIVS